MSTGAPGGMRERPAGPMMRAGTDYEPGQPNNVYASNPYGVSFNYSGFGS